MKEHLVPWAALWIESEPFEGALTILLTIIGSCLDYAASQGMAIPSLWSLLVDAFISSDVHLLLLLQKVRDLPFVFPQQLYAKGVSWRECPL